MIVRDVRKMIDFHRVWTAWLTMPCELTTRLEYGDVDPRVPSSVGRGWKMEQIGVDEDDEQLVVPWMDGQPAPQATLRLAGSNLAERSPNR